MQHICEKISKGLGSGPKPSNWRIPGPARVWFLRHFGGLGPGPGPLEHLLYYMLHICALFAYFLAFEVHVVFVLLIFLISTSSSVQCILQEPHHHCRSQVKRRALHDESFLHFTTHKSLSCLSACSPWTTTHMQLPRSSARLASATSINATPIVARSSVQEQFNPACSTLAYVLDVRAALVRLLPKAQQPA